MEALQHLGTYLAIIVLNCNGLRERRKKLALSRLLYEHSASIGVITETHLRQWEVNRLQIPNYHVVTSYCRGATDRAGGGGNNLGPPQHEC